MKYTLGVCDNNLYSKSDGSLKCGSFLEHGLTIKQASAQCAQINAIIPELPYQNDNQIINLLKVGGLSNWMGRKFIFKMICY